MRADHSNEGGEAAGGGAGGFWKVKLIARGGLPLDEVGPAVPPLFGPQGSFLIGPGRQRMAQKRHLEEEKGKGGMGYDGCSPGEKRQKVPDLGSVIVEVMKMNALQKLLSVIEPQLRRVVKEEVEMALAKHLATMKRQCGKQIYPSSSRSLQLQFVSKLSLPIFTGTKIEGEDCSGISLALVDTLTRKIVVSGPESLMKVEIVVLEGDFEVEEEIWTFDEFKSNIVKEREGKRPLLSGDVFLDLTEGTGVLGELAFTDNSSWTRSRKFRLGARVEDGYFNGIRIREAKTEPFMVKDHRGELYKKHYPPSLADEVWRLEKIGKDGAFHKRLGSENINTVKDFLTMLHLDTQRLRNILGTGMSAKMWEVTVEHARTCVLGSQVYTYYPGRQQKTGVAFNIVGEVVGVVSDGQYVPAGELSEAQKADSHKLVKAAYEHWEEVSLCDGGAATGGSSHASSVSYTAGGQPLVESFYHEFSGSCRTDGFGFAHPTISSPEMISSVLPTAARRRSFDAAAASVLQAMDSIESRYDPGFLSHGLYADSGDLFPTSLIFDGESTSQPLFAGDGDDQLHYFDADAPLLAGGGLRPDSPADLGSAVTGFLAAAAARGKVNRSWRTLISVLKWRFSIKRIVSLRRKDRFGVGNPPQRDLPRG